MSLELVIIGAEGAGKSLIAKRLKEISHNNGLDGNDIFPLSILNTTIPTVGMEISTIKIDGISVILRELGSSISNRWSSYYPEASGVIFVVDVSDMGWYPNALVLLHEAIAALFITELQKPLLIALNKLDMCDSTTYTIFRNYFDINKLFDYEPPNKRLITICEGSCSDGSVCTEVVKWIQSITPK
mmetsp:Transcript_34107/g.49548  ORF Transcript_34107/g.49548 Transcript_34107/m.49548 type:complete len:186 (-) Transcript_34107:1461-2018(-)